MAKCSRGQVAHAPLTQTMLLPQLIPSGLLASSVQTGAPDAQRMDAVRQGLDEVQAAPSLQATQLPAWLQTWSVPHVVPGVRNVPVSSQTGCPVVHETLPTWQTLAGVQKLPASQKLQVPEKQTLPKPQDAPFARGTPVSTHSPVAQSMLPT